MSTNVEEFRLFHQLLIKDRTDYQPFYFVLRPGGKEPLGERGPWKEASVTFEEACQWMKAGYNIAIAGTDHDPLVIIDDDKEGAIDDVKATLCVRTRKRTGRHYFYFTNDPRCKVNVPSAEHVGELRALWQYVVTAGSFVRTDPKKLETPPPEDQIPSLGSYTIEADRPVASITYDDLPMVFKKTMAEQGAQPPKREPRKWDREGPQSKLWTLTIEDVIGDHPTANFPSPFHGSETGSNTTVSNGLLHCWRHQVTLTPMQALAVKSGILDCMSAGDGHKGSGVGPSVIDWKDWDFVIRLWDFAKRNKIVPEDDLHPLGEDLPKKGGKKKGEKEKEEPRYAAHRKIGDVVYRQCVKDGVCKFARYDRTNQQLSYVDKIPETGEVPVPYETAIIATFPRELRPYGSPLDLYRRLKARFAFASDQTGHKNHIVVLYLMETGCSPPWKRKNFQLILIGLPATGKGRFLELCKSMGDRARLMTMPKEATNQRLNDLLGGGVEIIDESPTEDEELEAYIRSRYDPGTVNPRLLDPLSKTKIAGFRIAGPTIISRRKPFLDDANTDRGIVVWCERGVRFPLELLDRNVDLELQDQLALFWSEYYDDERLLPAQEELMYDTTVDEIDPRLKLATIYIMKLAHVIGDEAIADLKGFVKEQERLRRELKASTEEGLALHALYNLITERIGGLKHTITDKDGSKRKFVDTLTVEPAEPGRYRVVITRTPDGESSDSESRVMSITWTWLSKLAGLRTRADAQRLLEQHSVRQEPWTRFGDGHAYPLSFGLKKLDRAFSTLVPQYNEEWMEPFKSAPSQATLPVAEQPVAEATLPVAEQPVVVVANVANTIKNARAAFVTVLREEEKSSGQEDGNSETVHLAGKATFATKATDTQPKTPSELNGALRELEKLSTREEEEAQVDEHIRALQMCVAANADDEKRQQESHVLQWMIRRIVAGLASGDPVGAFTLRTEARREYSGWQADRAIEIVDSFFVEVGRVATLIYEAKKARDGGGS